jgi:tRNA-binding EMAP/Myf-like protein
MSGLAFVRKVVEVRDHPVAEKSHLGVFILDSGEQLIGVNDEDGSRRFNLGDHLVHVLPGAVIPEKIINSGFENVKGGKIKTSRFAGVESEGIMLNLDSFHGYVGTSSVLPQNLMVEPHFRPVNLGDDVTEELGIK